MKPDQSLPQDPESSGDDFYRGDLVTLRLLLGACVLMWSLGIVHIVVRICFR